MGLEVAHPPSIFQLIKCFSMCSYPLVKLQSLFEEINKTSNQFDDFKFMQQFQTEANFQFACLDRILEFSASPSTFGRKQLALAMNGRSITC